MDARFIDEIFEKEVKNSIQAYDLLLSLDPYNEKDLQKVEGIGPKLAGKVKIFTMNH